jgi:hypothetical protein
MKTWLRKLPCVVVLATTAGCSFDNAAAPAHGVPTFARTDLALGSGFSCGVTTAHASYCWGANEMGQGGNGSTFSNGAPTLVALEDPVAAISASESTTCSLSTSGTVSCWGVIPDGTPLGNPRATPVTIETHAPLVSLTVGSAFACGLDETGRAFCWGANGHGQLGTGDTLPHLGAMPVVDGIHFTQLAAGFAHVCGASRGGTVYCWGDNTYGEIGIGKRVSRVLHPTAIATSIPMQSVASGSIYACAIATDGLAYCWGDNSAGQLGDGTAHAHSTPQPVTGGLRFTSLAASRGNSVMDHTCGITTEHAAYCWGANSSGEAGGPAETACIAFGLAALCNTLPIAVRSLGAAVAVDAGTTHSCAILTDGSMSCWGDNDKGEIGDGTHSDQTAPVALPGGLRFH